MLVYLYFEHDARSWYRGNSGCVSRKANGIPQCDVCTVIGHDHRFGHPVWFSLSQQLQNKGLQAESSAEFSVLAETMIMAAYSKGSDAHLGNR